MSPGPGTRLCHGVPCKSNHRRPPWHPGDTETRQRPRERRRPAPCAPPLCPIAVRLTRWGHTCALGAGMQTKGPAVDSVNRPDAGAPSFADLGLRAPPRLPAGMGPGWVLLSGCLGASADLPSHCHFQTSCSRSIMTFLHFTEVKTGPAQPGPWRGGRRDPGGPSNWFICQIIRGSEGAVIGHGLLGSQARGPAAVGCAGTGAAVTLEGP